MGEIFRNNVSITSVHNTRGKQFAFGVTLEPNPRTIFFPYWIIKAFELTADDQGYVFDCLFIEQNNDKNPVAVAILDDDVILESSQLVGMHQGRPGTADFTAIVNIANRKHA